MATHTSENSLPGFWQTPGHRIGLACVLAVCILSEVNAAAAPGIQDPRASQQDLSALIRQLGDDDFRVRELAEKQILEIGAPAIPHLKQARFVGDVEIRLRSRRMLVRVLRADYEQRIQKFVASTDPVASFGLNGWREYSAIAGHDENARLLFVAMQETEKDLFLSWDRTGTGTDQAGNAVMAKLGARAGPNILPTLACAILIKTLENRAFVESDSVNSGSSSADVDRFVGGQSAIANRLDENRVVRAIESGPYNSVFRRLLQNWLDSLPDSVSSTTLKLRVVIRLGLENYLEFAAQSARNHEIAVDLRAESIAMVARSGKLKYLTSLEQLLTDETLVGEFQTDFGQERPIRVEIRDVALAALVFISGQAYSEFGFEGYQGLDEQFIILSQAGFASSRERQSALDKWDAFKVKLTGDKE